MKHPTVPDFRRRRGQTLVEYALMIALISLVVMSTMEEAGYYVKGQMVSTECALIWAQYNTAGGEAGDNIDYAYEQVKAFVVKHLNRNERERAIADKILKQQEANRDRLKATAGVST